ncbi:LON peptidase substrate-binding domain-containing protein [Nocardioides daeguensis]|uniref:LON peptidase substrate-binding domain-containing protein n=1 Tax=Nocardioides daeguensis TaxID=908359 RepID=A0ABP6USS0_9ACTN|nr:LON peptidase substrate-binding domain-containing protein [Nocardioides daeguensis]MBV6725668.1 LON peptidase substrate-binding domain-containing protein [Nocardioides daeguensis]MCR1772817.1 LON peptidase substrate-binding domain-containing protein [Nocardioides daeguensis]
MTDQLPMFPLNAVLYPGVSVPLHVFEDRYRALVHHLLRIEDPSQRLFGTVAIREGYEVGDHGNHSVYRIGVRLQLTEVEARADGSFDIVAVGRDRIQLNRLLGSGDYPVGEVAVLPNRESVVPEELVQQARATFTAYRHVVRTIAGDPLQGELPKDPTYLSWTLAACTPLPMGERQQLLEAGDTAERLALVIDLLRTELRAINVITSLPATEVARTRWSPN